MDKSSKVHTTCSASQLKQSLLVATTNVPVCPAFNCDDLPEVKIVERKANKRSLRRKDRARSRVKTLEFSAVFNSDTLVDSDEGWAVVSQETPKEDWNCQTCTFLNHGIVFICEMCNTRKDASSAFPQLVSQHSATCDLRGDWPSIQDTPTSCVHSEVSSVDSTWLNVYDSADCEADGSEASFGCITCCEVKQVSSDRPDRKQYSWADRVAINAPNKMLPGTRLGGVVVPSSWGNSASLKCPNHKNVQEFDNDNNVELKELENRRMFPLSTLGKTQRLRATSLTQIPCQPKQQSKEDKMKAAFANIGVFDDYAGIPGAHILKRSEPSCDGVGTKTVQHLFAQLGIAPGGCFEVIPTVLLESNERKLLIKELDARCNGEPDLKLPLTEEELGNLIGPSHVAQLVALLPHGVDQIYIRRCAAHGKYIRFHLDVAMWTLQLPLNDPEDYQGGKLLYATQDGHLACPHRAAGTATLHDASMLHGVTKLESGVRYSLYFLQLEPEPQ